MLLEKPAMRVVAVSSVLLFGLATSAMADIVPFDPHGLFATGGDATDINSGQPITLSSPGGGNTGGGIFVFTNNTGTALSGVDVNITLPNSFGAFSFTGTIFTPGAGTTSTTETIVPGPCDPSLPAASFCVELAFSASPQPLVPVGGNFVLDFDKGDSGSASRVWRRRRTSGDRELHWHDGHFRCAYRRVVGRRHRICCADRRNPGTALLRRHFGWLHGFVDLFPALA
jgi:hypothetical protein